MRWELWVSESGQAVGTLLAICLLVTVAHIWIARMPFSNEPWPPSEHPLSQKLWHRRQSRRDRIQYSLVREYRDFLFLIAVWSVLVIYWLN